VVVSRDLKVALLTYVFSLVIFAGLGSVVMSLDPVVGLALTSTLIAFLPTAVASRWSPLGWRRALHIAPLRPVAAGWILLAAPCAFLVAGQLAALQARILPIPAEYLSYFEAILRSVNARGPLIGILVVAVLPALGEEPLFRGLLLSALRRRMHPVGASLTVGLLFALFHIDPYRLASTAFLGFFLALVVIQTGSLFAAILAHLLNNLGAELVVIFNLIPDQAAYSMTRLLPWPLVLLAALLLGFCLTRMRARPAEREPAAQTEPTDRA